MACNSEKVEHHRPSSALHFTYSGPFPCPIRPLLSKFHLHWPPDTFTQVRKQDTGNLSYSAICIRIWFNYKCIHVLCPITLIHLQRLSGVHGCAHVLCWTCPCKKGRGVSTPGGCSSPAKCPVETKIWAPDIGWRGLPVITTRERERKGAGEERGRDRERERGRGAGVRTLGCRGKEERVYCSLDCSAAGAVKSTTHTARGAMRGWR